jgi:hypothetical protein
MSSLTSGLSEEKIILSLIKLLKFNPVVFVTLAEQNRKLIGKRWYAPVLQLERTAVDEQELHLSPSQTKLHPHPNFL